MAKKTVTELFVETEGKQFDLTGLEAEVKAFLKEEHPEIKMKDIEGMRIYVKPMEEEVYFALMLANGEELTARLK